MGSCLAPPPVPRLVTLQTRFLSQDEVAGGPPPRASSGTAAARGCARSCGRGGSASSGQGSKNRGPPCALASQVTQPHRHAVGDWRASAPGPRARPSSKTMGILTMPSSRSCCGPLCSTRAPKKSTATSSLSNDRLSRTTMSPLFEPLEKTIFHRGFRTFSRYFGPPTAVASTVAQPRGSTGIRCKPVAWPLTKTSQGPACCT
mmetsp:Transcript_103122/g.321352  ORF Transcript_103122/g.321352 Transcript_103122/m.321352 type:complete len:203 (+) Transcript_103122:349-957(+)